MWTVYPSLLEERDTLTVLACGTDTPLITWTLSALCELPRKRATIYSQELLYPG